MSVQKGSCTISFSARTALVHETPIGVVIGDAKVDVAIVANELVVIDILAKVRRLLLLALRIPLRIATIGCIRHIHRASSEGE